MDLSLYKTFSVPGSFQYRYYYQAPKAGKPTLLFLHGFPSLVSHWAKQVKHFTGKGYGVVALDMLGYGGSSRPSEIKAYAGIQHAEDCIKILDEEGLEKVIVIGHDWGCRVESRLADLFPDRHLASIYISVAYGPPVLDGNATIERFKLSGRDNFGYWRFFNSDEAPQLLAKHIDSWYTLIYTSDPAYWTNHFAPEGALKEWLLADRKAPIESWAPDKDEFKTYFGEDEWRTAVNWYRVGMRMEHSEKEIALNDAPRVLKHPVLVVCTTKDAICLPSLAKAGTEAACGGANAPNLTFKEIETTHWPMLEKPDELNVIIEEYIDGLLKA